MRTRSVFALAAALLVLAVCSSCGGGGGGGSAGERNPTLHADVAITWRDADDVAGWVVHWGTASRVYDHTVDVAKPAADGDGNVTVVIAIDGVTESFLYFALTSYDAAANSSAYSNELALSTDAISD